MTNAPLKSQGICPPFSPDGPLDWALIERDSCLRLLSGSLYRSAGQSALFYPEFAPATMADCRNLDGDRLPMLSRDVQYGELPPARAVGRRERKLFPLRPTARPSIDSGVTAHDEGAYVDLSDHRSLSAETDLDVRIYYD